MDWLKNRWSEPESRAAVAAVAPILGAWISHTIDTPTALYALAGCALAFVFPGFHPPNAPH